MAASELKGQDDPVVKDAVQPTHDSVEGDQSSQSIQDAGTLSDPENAERSTREKLKQTDLEDARGLTATAGIPSQTQPPTSSVKTSVGQGETSAYGLKNNANSDIAMTNDDTYDRQTLRRKRGAEEDEDQDNEYEAERHVRKKSKDLSGSPRDVPQNNTATEPSHEPDTNGVRPSTPSGEPMLEDDASITSPKNKRPHADAFDKIQDSASNGLNKGQKPASLDTIEPVDSSEPSAKRSKDILLSTSTGETKSDSKVPSVTPLAKLPAGSGFSNTSSSSPFGSVGGKSVFGGGANSTFGSLGANKSSAPAQASVFGNKGSTTASATGFGGLLGSTPSDPATSADKPKLSFGSSAGGFGALTGSSAKGFGGFSGAGSAKSSVFRSTPAKSPPISGLSSATPRAFGAPVPEEDAGEEEDDEEKSVKDNDDTAQATIGETSDTHDSRFYTQNLGTGEEGETTRFQCKVKMFHFATQPDGKKEWKERAKGVLRFNVTAAGNAHLADDLEASAKSTDTKRANGTKVSARFILRAEGSHRVLLNTPISKDMKIGDPKGEKPAGTHAKAIFFSGTIDDSFELLQFRLREENALSMYEAVREAQQEM